MYSDTHFHFLKVAASYDAAQVLTGMAEHGVQFAQDIGTRCDDLPERTVGLQAALDAMDNDELRSRIAGALYISAGIWPDPDAIRDRVNQVAVLAGHIKKALDASGTFAGRLCALGECGIDHHWNPSGVDGRDETEFDGALYQGERELFIMQLELARSLGLPVIVHSRDAFEDTYECIKEAGYDRGVIHCYSYGVDEARKFLDRGWYISFSGSVTYTKKSKMEQMTELLRYVPDDRILLETDAPYLAPVPCRGRPNSPLLIEHTYRFVSEIRQVPLEYLCSTVDTNSRSLFLR